MAFSLEEQKKLVNVFVGWLHGALCELVKTSCGQTYFSYRR